VSGLQEGISEPDVSKVIERPKLIGWSSNDGLPIF
jgi:hypothetical protein